MSHYTFTAADRDRAAETRAANKAAKEKPTPRFQVTADNMESVGYALLTELHRLALTAGDEGTRVRAASRALAHLLPSLRSVEFELNSLDPRNIAEESEAWHDQKYGRVDPAEFSGPGDVPAETPLPEDSRPLKKLKPGVIIE